MNISTIQILKAFLDSFFSFPFFSPSFSRKKIIEYGKEESRNDNINATVSISWAGEFVMVLLWIVHIRRGSYQSLAFFRLLGKKKNRTETAQGFVSEGAQHSMTGCCDCVQQLTLNCPKYVSDIWSSSECTQRRWQRRGCSLKSTK